MFGLIISGRPVDAAPQAVTETQYAFRISPVPAFNHIVLFVLPGVQFPPGTAATVYVQLPPCTEFRLLGAIGPGKESAIFKVSGLKPGVLPTDPDGDVMADDAGVGTVASGEIVVGLSLEPAAQVEAQLATLQSGLQQGAAPTTGVPSTALVRSNAAAAGQVTTKMLAQRIIGNAFNFLASFGSDTVPLKAFQDWWAKFEKKIDLDASFLEREQ